MAIKKNRSYNNSSITQPSIPNGQKAVELFASMMVERIQKLKDEPWQKGWLNATGFSGMPKNIDGRNYSASNAFFLQLISDMKHYELPVFMTFNQAKNMGVSIIKGAKSFPVIYWDINVKDKDGKRIDWETYRNLEKSSRKDYIAVPFLKSYPVFNIDQTNFREIKPEKMEALKREFSVGEIKDNTGMYVHPSLDRMIDTQSWYCPIRANKPENQAFYSPSLDIVVLPMKEQFKKGTKEEDIYRDGMEFYSTMLHEMTHSTMKPDRLNRDGSGRFGDKKYAKEELVAELTAAMLCHSMGFDSKITDNSAKYLDNWLGALKEEPKFILSVMSDVNKASEMILDKIDEQKMALGEKPFLTKNLIAQDEYATIEEEMVPFKESMASEQKAALYVNPDNNPKVEVPKNKDEIMAKDLSPNKESEKNNTVKENPQMESPLLRQYNEMKSKHPDAILLFRIGDFYETFKEDAIKASDILGITMTRRVSGTGYIELAGFPHHALDTYLPKLVKAGARVAICEQLEQPEKKKLAKRGITEKTQKETSKDKQEIENKVKAPKPDFNPWQDLRGSWDIQFIPVYKLADNNIEFKLKFGLGYGTGENLMAHVVEHDGKVTQTPISPEDIELRKFNKISNEELIAKYCPEEYRQYIPTNEELQEIDKNLKNDDTMAKKKKNEEQLEQAPQAVTEEQTTGMKADKAGEKSKKAEKSEEKKPDIEKGIEAFEKYNKTVKNLDLKEDEFIQVKKTREPQMVTVNGDKVSHGHIFKIKDTDAPWFFTANINGDKLKPIPINDVDATKFLEKQLTIPEMMEKYYPTKIMAKVPEVAFKTPNVISDGPDKQMTVEKFNVYKEKEESKQDFGRYKFYAVVDGQKMSVVAERKDLNAYFDRVQTPGQLTEKVFGERLGLKSHYQQFSLPEGMDKKAIRIEKNQQTNKFDIYLDLGKGQKSEVKQLTGYDTNALLRTKAANKEQLGAKYLSTEIASYMSQGLHLKQEKQASLKI